MGFFSERIDGRLRPTDSWFEGDVACWFEGDVTSAIVSQQDHVPAAGEPHNILKNTPLNDDFVNGHNMSSLLQTEKRSFFTRMFSNGPNWNIKTIDSDDFKRLNKNDV